MPLYKSLCPVNIQFCIYKYNKSKTKQQEHLYNQVTTTEVADE